MHRILVVEDEPLLALGLVQVFEEADFHAVSAGTVEAALRKLVEEPPTAAVLDASLSGVWSAEVAAALEHIDVPYVVYSGSRWSEIEPWAHPVEFIEKPAPLRRVLEAVQRTVEVRRLEAAVPIN